MIHTISYNFDYLARIVGRRTLCASPPTVEHSDWIGIDRRESFEAEAASNVKIVSYNPGHDGYAAYLIMARRLNLHKQAGYIDADFLRLDTFPLQSDGGPYICATPL